VVSCSGVSDAVRRSFLCSLPCTHAFACHVLQTRPCLRALIVFLLAKTLRFTRKATLQPTHPHTLPPHARKASLHTFARRDAHTRSTRAPPSLPPPSSPNHSHKHTNTSLTPPTSHKPQGKHASHAWRPQVRGRWVVGGGRRPGERRREECARERQGLASPLTHISTPHSRCRPSPCPSPPRPSCPGPSPR